MKYVLKRTPVAVYCWYMKDAFAGFCHQILKKNSEGILGKIDKKAFVTLNRFWLLSGWGYLGESFKKENLWQKCFSDNVEWSSKKL